MRGRVVEKFHDERVPFERLLHDAPLNADPAAVDEAHLTQPGGVRFVQVFRDDRRDIARREGVEVQLSRDGQDDGLAVVPGAQGATCADSASSTGASQRSISCAAAPFRRR